MRCIFRRRMIGHRGAKEATQKYLISRAWFGWELSGDESNPKTKEICLNSL